MYRECYYCGKIVMTPVPMICPKCGTKTKWVTEEQSMQSAIDNVITASILHWEYGKR